MSACGVETGAGNIQRHLASTRLQHVPGEACSESSVLLPQPPLIRVGTMRAFVAIDGLTRGGCLLSPPSRREVYTARLACCVPAIQLHTHALRTDSETCTYFVNEVWISAPVVTGECPGPGCD
jgi:hypothetical protein